jgi:hypothetical protein
MDKSKDSFAAKLESIQPVAGIRAIAPNADAKGVQLDSARAIAELSSLDEKETRAFEDAGWKFVRTDDRAGDSNVVVDNDGRLKVVSNSLNVKFDPSMSRTDIDSVLAQHGLSVRRDLKFSPNLFTVTGSDGGTVEKAITLNSLDKVLYAEPVLIEAIGQRGR